MAWGMKNIVVCLFGSSIMEGRIGVEDPIDRWYNIFQRRLSRAFPDTCFPIINSAVGGESTREIMRRFDRDVLARNPDFCLVMIGGNNHDCRNPDRILVEGELEKLMEDFARRLPEKTTPVGVVLSPVVDDWHFASRNPAYRDYLLPFNGSLDAAVNVEREKARSFYRRQGWAYLDLHALMADRPADYVLPQDGIHMNQAGHAFFAQEMFKCMETILLSGRQTA
ncbi:MAG: SGNH/GDSL hydrolase family protein [Kiritimatiellia bacterium]